MVVTCRLRAWLTRRPKIPSVDRPSRGPVQTCSPLTEKLSSSPTASSDRRFFAVWSPSGLVAKATIAGCDVQPWTSAVPVPARVLDQEFAALAQEEVGVALIRSVQVRAADEEAECLAAALGVEEEGLGTRCGSRRRRPNRRARRSWPGRSSHGIRAAWRLGRDRPCWRLRGRSGPATRRGRAVPPFRPGRRRARGRRSTGRRQRRTRQW